MARTVNDDAGSRPQNERNYNQGATAEDTAARDQWNNYNTTRANSPFTVTRPARGQADRTQRRRQNRYDNRTGKQSQVDINAQLAMAQQQGRKSVYDSVADQMEEAGIPAAVVQRVLRGLPDSAFDSVNEVTDAVRATPEWQKLYGGTFEALRKNGNPMNEAEILTSRQSYRETLNFYNVPGSFYKDPKRIDEWMLNGVSPEEIGSRAKMAEQVLANKDKNLIRSFKEFYGIGRGALIGYMLDNKLGMEEIQRQIDAATIGAAAKTSGLDEVGVKRAERLVDKGVDAQKAQQAFGTVAATEADWKNLAAMGRENLTEANLINAELELDNKGKQRNKLKRLASQERGRFGGSGGGTGSMGTSTSGSY